MRREDIKLRPLSVYLRAKIGNTLNLDALEPTVIAGLIEGAIAQFQDPDLWADAVAEEEAGLRLLQEAAARWGDVADFLGA